MLYDAMFSVDLPSAEGLPLRTGWLDGLERLAFTGRFHRRRAECSLTAGAVLAGCYQALRQLGAGEVRVEGDADEVVDLTISPDQWGEAPARWAEVLPAAWTTEPAGFRLRARVLEQGVVAVVHLRYAPRHEAGAGALVGALRAAWRVRPEDGEDLEQLVRESLSWTDPFGTRLPGLPLLRRRLASRGERLGECLARSLERTVQGARVFTQGRVVVLWGEDRFGELLRGFDDEERACLLLLARLVGERGGRWLAIGPEGVEGRVRGERFVPVSEGGHAV